MINSHFKDGKVFGFFIPLKMTKIKGVKRGRTVVLSQKNIMKIYFLSRISSIWTLLDGLKTKEETLKIEQVNLFSEIIVDKMKIED
jgi:hypothetical protein